MQLPALKFTVGQWVVVKYEVEDFPGEVTRIENSDVEVNVMHRSANAWKWPKLQDKIYYSRDKIMWIINPPSGSRGHRHYLVTLVLHHYMSSPALSALLRILHILSLITCVRPSHHLLTINLIIQFSTVRRWVLKLHLCHSSL